MPAPTATSGIELCLLDHEAEARADLLYHRYLAQRWHHAGKMILIGSELALAGRHTVTSEFPAEFSNWRTLSENDPSKKSRSLIRMNTCTPSKRQIRQTIYWPNVSSKATKMTWRPLWTPPVILIRPFKR